MPAGTVLGSLVGWDNFQNIYFIEDYCIQTGYLVLMDIPGVSAEQLYRQTCEVFPAILSLLIKRSFPGFISGNYKSFLQESSTETYWSMPPLGKAS